MENEIKYIKEQSILINEIASNTDTLFKKINDLSAESINVLIKYYDNSTGPLNILRLTVLKFLQKGTVIDDQLVQEIKDQFNTKNLDFFREDLKESTIEHIKNYRSPKGGDPFHAWSDPFRIFCTFFYNENKTMTQQYMNAIGQDLINKLGLHDYSVKIVDFMGTQNQGSQTAWVAVFPKHFKSYNSTVQIFCEFTAGKVYAGIYKGSNAQTDEIIEDQYRKKEYNSYDEIIEALHKSKNVAVKINNKLTVPDYNASKKRYWMYAPGENSSMWDEFYNQKIMGIGWDELGNLSQYLSKEEIKSKMKALYGVGTSYKNDGHATWQFANEMSIGDIIFVKNGRDKIVGRGVVESKYIFDEARNNYKNIRQVNWTHKGLWEHKDGQIVLKALTDLTPYTEYCKKLESLFSDNLITEESDQYELYSEDDFLAEVFMDEEKYETLVNILINKKNVILQGAPGVGKTYIAKRLAYSIIGKKDISRVKMVQFHQSYGYEDFIMGYRPSDNGFELKYGPFYEFCKEAEKDRENIYFFIIDEINRGNLSKIFGELLMLIETDKRNESIRLLYSDEQFSVPDNIHIIGMMNTADRSLAIIDYALRRRFAFYEFEPAFETDNFKEYQLGKTNEKFDNLIQIIISLNNAISLDSSLGEGFKIGHSYFCTEDIVDDNWLNSVINYEIIPLLKEYWFDEPEKIKNWSTKLKLAIK